MRSLRTRSIAFLLFLALVASPIVIGASGSESAFADEEVVIAIKDEIQIEEMLKAVGEALQMPMIWDPQDKQIRGKQVKGSVDIRTTRKNLLNAVRSVLTFYELVMIPVGPSDQQVMLVMDARRTTSILKLKAQPIQLNERNLSEYEHADGLYVTTMISAENMEDLRNARNALTRVVTGQNIGNVTEVPAAKGFIVTDFAPNVVAIYRLIKQMDDASARGAQAAPSRAFRAVSLKHASADQMMMILSRLFPPPNPSPTPQADAVPMPKGPRIQSDARTNQILVTGAQGEVDQVLEAIAAIDVDTPRPEIEAHVIRLQHLEAYPTASEISSMIGSQQLLWRDQSDARTRPAVVASAEINALLVSADGSTYERIRRLVSEMDEIAGERKGAGDK